MIYTLTLNPSLDYIMKVKDFALGTTNRSESEHIHIGGKGVNVSIVLHHLDVKSSALGFLGGFTGNYLQQQLASYGNISEQFLTYTDNTRINIKIKGENETEINSAGAEIPEALLQELESMIARLTNEDFIILAGSMAKGMPENWYLEIAKKLSKHQVSFAIDIASQQLLDILQYNPLFIKPNQAELEELFGVQDLSEEELIYYARKMVEMGAKHVIVSRGSAGSLMVTAEKTYVANVPKGKLIDSVGAGDSMVAGFIYGYFVKSLGSKDAFRYASSCGTATAYSTHLAEKEFIEELYQKTSIEEI